MKILLIRHGTTKGNLEKRYVGRTDEELTESCVQALSGAWEHRAGKSGTGESETGESGAWEAVIREPGTSSFKTVYVSPMKRCLMTKELLFPKERYSELKTVTVDGFRECDFGEFEYKNYQELSGSAAYQHFIDTMGAEGFPGGETTKDFKRRCVLAFQEIVERELLLEEKSRRGSRPVSPGGPVKPGRPGAPDFCPDQTLAFVVHGGTIMAVMEEFAIPKGDYYSWQVKNLEGFSARISLDEESRFCLTDVAKVCIL